MKRYFFIICLYLTVVANLKAQSGEAIYTFLEIPVSSHMAAIGGTNVSLRTDDINYAFKNPSLLTDKTDKQLALNVSNYISDVTVGSVAYGKNFNDNMLGFGLQYIDYGTFEGTTEANQSTGTFTAKDFAFSFIYAKNFGNSWQGGLTLKPIYSAYESYSSFGLAVDLGVSYADLEKQLYVGAALQNIGSQLKSYNEAIENLPFNTMISFSKKFTHAPIRISTTAHHLHLWDLNYANTLYTTSLDGEKVYETVSFVDMLFRHLIFGVDLLPSKNLYLSLGYNHQRAAELRVNGSKTIAGFSFGGGLKIKKFHVGFSAAQYQKGIMSYQFSLITNMNSFKKKDAKKEDNSSN